MEKNSFISNFNKLPKGLLFFAAIFVLAEFTTSQFSKIVVKQTRNFCAYNRTAKKEYIKVVAIGNSAIETGIDTPLLSNILSRSNAGEKITCFNMGIGALPISVNYFIFKNIIIPEEPSLVIIGFWCNGLSGSNIRSFDTYHTLRYYTRLSDIPVLFKVSLTEFGDRVDFILRKISYVYSYRYIIKHGIKLILRDLIVKKRLPRDLIKNRVKQIKQMKDGMGFRPVSQVELLMNIRPGKMIAEETAEEKTAGRHKYYYLNGIANLAKEKNTKLLFVAMPKLKKYNVPEEIKLFLQKNNIGLIDFSSTEKYDKYLLDEEHLDKEGASLLTREIADFLL